MWQASKRFFRDIVRRQMVNDRAAGEGFYAHVAPATHVRANIKASGLLVSGRPEPQVRTLAVTFARATSRKRFSTIAMRFPPSPVAVSF
jgi:hypothetical protein